MPESRVRERFVPISSCRVFHLRRLCNKFLVCRKECNQDPCTCSNAGTRLPGEVRLWIMDDRSLPFTSSPPAPLSVGAERREFCLREALDTITRRRGNRFKSVLIVARYIGRARRVYAALVCSRKVHSTQY